MKFKTVKSLAYLIGTGLGSGYSPLAPGTAGSILAAVIAFFLLKGNFPVLLVLVVVFLVVGWWSAAYLEEELQQSDPSCVVVDEMVGMWISLLAVPVHWKYYLIAFFLFRLFDIWKPFPINRSQTIKNGWGVMIDDVLAGLYAFILVQIVLRII